MKPYYLLLLLWVALGCSDDTAEEKAITRLTYMDNAAVVAPDPQDPLPVASIGPGDKRVFRYEYKIPADPNIADSGFTEILLFEVDAELTSFTATGLALIQLSPYYRQICFCATNASEPVTGGTLTGTRKTDTQWEVTINVQFPYGEATKELQVSGIFLKEE